MTLTKKDLQAPEQAKMIEMRKRVEARVVEEKQNLRDAEAVKRIIAHCKRYAEQGDLSASDYIIGFREGTHEALAARGGNPRRGFGWTLIGDVGMKPVEWAIEGIAEMNTCLSVFGAPGDCKTFLAVDWACSMASGIPWQGRKVRQGLVLCLLGEGLFGFRRRVAAWGAHHGVDADGLPVALSTTAAALCDPASLEEVIASIEEIAAIHGPPVAIFIDTLARNFGPGNEDSTQDMTAFVAAADRIREIFGSMLALIHHSGHGDKTRSRGNSSLRGALDMEYRMKRSDGGLVLQCTKSKDHEPPEDIHLALITVELPTVGDDGEPMTSAVIVEGDQLPQIENSTSGGPGLGKVQAEVLAVLQSLSEASTDSWVDCSIWSSSARERGVERQGFYRAKKGLAERGFVLFRDNLARPTGGFPREANLPFR